jgi:long-chain acyl-CoA synthetase
VQQLLDQPGFDDPAITGTLMGLGFGGAGLSQRLIQRTLQARPDSLSGIGFGMTETNGVGSAASGQLFACQPECSGICSPLVDIRIVNDWGEDCRDGQTGEVYIRSVTLMDAYWNQPEATAKTLQQGWLHTGDIGCLEPGGYLRIVDRIKDIINRNGEKIAAAEVESCLLEHPMVDEAAVMALPDALTGECVAAVVSLKPSQSIDAASLTNFVATKLAAHKVPKYLHVCHAPLPKTATGKVLKKTLHHLFSTTVA